MILLDEFPAPHPQAGIERVEGRLIAASPDDHLHTFVDDEDEPSYTAERILELADGRRTVRQIAQTIAREFEGASAALVATDVKDFVQTLVERQVLVLHNHPSP